MHGFRHRPRNLGAGEKKAVDSSDVCFKVVATNQKVETEDAAVQKAKYLFKLN
jgi:hypothetical protein